MERGLVLSSNQGNYEPYHYPNMLDMFDSFNPRPDYPEPSLPEEILTIGYQSTTTAINSLSKLVSRSSDWLLFIKDAFPGTSRLVLPLWNTIMDFYMNFLKWLWSLISGFSGTSALFDGAFAWIWSLHKSFSVQETKEDIRAGIIGFSESIPRILLIMLFLAFVTHPLMYISFGLLHRCTSKDGKRRYRRTKRSRSGRTQGEGLDKDAYHNIATDQEKESAGGAEIVIAGQGLDFGLRITKK
ncbi:hypothetical protein FPQ18DRAFT_392312 [Pyronema domesticum]|nr:hypothetical protein FPQ18DRAFT_392312 [Pyronema domesticum]